MSTFQISRILRYLPNGVLSTYKHLNNNNRYFIEAQYVDKKDRNNKNVNIYEIRYGQGEYDCFKLSVNKIVLTHPDITKVLRYHSGSDIIFFHFYNNRFDVGMFYKYIQSGMCCIKTLTNYIDVKDNYFHEIFAKDVPTRFFLDLDFKDSYDNVLPKILESLRDLVNRDLEHVQSRNEYFDGGKDYKIHIIFKNIILPDIRSCKTLGYLLKDKVNDLGINPEYIDCQQYCISGSLRMLNGIKENKRKVCLSDDINPESYIIQSRHFQANELGYNFYNTEYCNEDVKSEDLMGIDLDKYKLKVVSHPVPHCYGLEHEAGEECPLCLRVHDKRDTMYLIKYKSKILLKCHRCNADFQNGLSGKKSIVLYESKAKMLEKLEEIKPVDYNKLDVKYKSYYNSKYAELPEFIDGDVLYINSPCMSGKTNLIRDFLEEYANGESIIFLTTQRLFSQNMQDRFASLGFINYLDPKFQGDEKRVICSIYSLHRLKNTYDYVIIDEYETLVLSGISNISKLGHQSNHKINFNTLIKLIQESHLCVCMDAYVSQYGINFMSCLGKDIHLHFNEYKTHINDKVIFTEHNDFIAKMAESLYGGKNVVFASGYKKQSNDVVNRVMALLKEKYDFEINELSVLQYNSDLDKSEMSDSILDIDNTWKVNLLIYSPSITAGISFEQQHFDEVFYLMNPNNGHIPALQALYRVRDIKEKTYYITYSRCKRNYFNEDYMRLKFEYLLNYDTYFTKDQEYKKLSKNQTNDVLINSMKYFGYSCSQFYELFVGQLKYNESKIQFGINEDFEEDEEFLKEHNKMLNKCTKYYDEITQHLRESYQLEPQDFIAINDDDFKKLEDKVNRTNKEHEIFLINLYIRTFKNFNKRYYNELKKDHKRYKEYHEYYTDTNKFTKLHIDTTIKDLKGEVTLLIQDRLNMRFRISVATMLLHHIYWTRTYPGEEIIYSDLDNYHKYHDYFVDKIITLDEIKQAFKHIYDYHKEKEDNKKVSFIKMFEVTYFANGRDRCKNYLWARDWKSYIPLISKILGSTYNLNVEKHKIKNKMCIKLVREMILY